MAYVDFSALKGRQTELVRSANFENKLSIEQIKYVAGFSVSFRGTTCVCAATVMDFKTMKVVEKKFLITKSEMNYLPGFEAFREGPAICQLYYDLEYEPEVIMVSGHGLAHPSACGLATFIGVELGKPTLGAAKNLLFGEEKDGAIFYDGQAIGKVIKTREYANPLYVSPGNHIDVELSAQIVAKCVVPPHKLPEPLHIAHRQAKKILDEQKEVHEPKIAREQAYETH